MSLSVGLAALALIAGAYLVRRAYEECLWRRDERRAWQRLEYVALSARAREIWDDGVWGPFKGTHDEIEALPVADPWDVAL